MSSTLYIVAGASCSGKSTLLRAWQCGEFDLFGDEAASDELLPVAGRADVPILFVAQFIRLAKSRETPPNNLVLHVDLSNFFKSEFRQGELSFWRNRMKRQYISDLITGPVPVLDYWKEHFSYCTDTPVALSSFSRVLVSTIWCRRGVAAERKLLRDNDKFRSDTKKAQRRRHVFSRIYAATPEAKENYLSHYQGWNLFLDGLRPQPARRLIWSDRPGGFPALMHGT